MEKKNSYRVTLLVGCILIILSLRNVISLIRCMTDPFSLIFNLLILIGSIGVLRLLPWARKLTIWAASLQLFYNLISILPVLMLPANIKRLSSTKEVHAPSIQALSGVQTKLLFLIAITSIIQLCIIYYFTRPKVKEQFK